MIKRSDFNIIFKNLNDKDDINILKTQFPNISYSTFVAIFSQKRSKNYRNLCYRKIHNLKQHYNSFINSTYSFTEISIQIGISSSIFAKQMLTYIIECEPQCLFDPNLKPNQYSSTELGKLVLGQPTSTTTTPSTTTATANTNNLETQAKPITDTQTIVKTIFKKPNIIGNPLLRSNILQSIYNDDNCSPLINHIRSSTGSEYEYLLQEKLFKLNIPYLSESELRKNGYPKTPDIKLEVPIAYKGQIINWIESKASFCDDNNFRNTIDQIIGYKNRYGPGLAIFWFGFIEDLNDMQEQGVIISDCFPDLSDIEILCK
ncbi:hypothetical protein CYY_006453 [Polysphondylium violaceum]|uniref:CDAN1-interacting nuclease 1 n=1 Tax=Polysphondylium violaceum TaxID=133409 RepID=A0A8J4PSN1_9MYCE|nr:hypothetical protein CYY_006453 [Polysphondylium violaceum]